MELALQLNLRTLRRELAEIRRVVVKAFNRAHRFTLRMMRQHGIKLNDLRREAISAAAIVGLAASVLSAPVLASGVTAESIPLQSPEATASVVPQPTLGPSIELANPSIQFSEALSTAVPEAKGVLVAEQEAALEQVVSSYFGVSAKAELQGIRLNVLYGRLGIEQHLPLYPGDTLANHRTDHAADLTGMVPGLPAYGYFANSKAEVTQDDILAERYGFVAQTFESPGFREHVEKYYKFYKHRKFIVVNPATGKACVVKLVDAGPNTRLDRKFGGSPEVFYALDAQQKDPIYALFVDDPDNNIPLGPISLK